MSTVDRGASPVDVSVVSLAQLEAAAGGRDHALREQAGDRLVAMVTAGGADADAAMQALCRAELARLHHYFALRVDDEHDAVDLTRDLLDRVCAVHASAGLVLRHGARSFYRYVYTAARRDVAHHLRKRVRAAPADPADLDLADRPQPTVEELAGSWELGSWLRQATHHIKDDYELVLLAYTQDLPRRQLIEASGVAAHRFDRVLYDARIRVTEHLLTLHLARTRPCAAGEWNRRDPAGFTPQVYQRTRRHLKGCDVCRQQYAHSRKVGLAKDFLVIPILAMPAALAAWGREESDERAAAAVAVSRDTPATAPAPATVVAPADIVAAPRPPSPVGGLGGRILTALAGNPSLGRLADAVLGNPAAAGGTAVVVAVSVAAVVFTGTGGPAASPDPRPSATAVTAPGTAAPAVPTSPPSSGGPGAPGPAPSAPASPVPTGADPGSAGTGGASAGQVLQGSPNWGYVYVDKATEAEAPIGTATPLNLNTQWSTAADYPATTGQQALVTHTGTGRYQVRLPGLGAERAVTHVTAYRTVYRGRVCAVADYRRSGTDELVDVRCFDHTGAPIDWWFTVFVAAAAGGTQPYATVAYSAAGIRAAGTANSAGGTNSVTRTGTGRYQVQLPGRDFAAGTGGMMLTTFGTAAARCRVAGTASAGDALTVSVACQAVTTGAATARDSGFLLTYTDRAGPHRDGSAPSAYTLVSGGAAPHVDAARSYSSDGETPSVSRLNTGWYRLTWTSLGKFGDSVQLTAYGDDDRYCHLGAINSYSAPPKLTVDVYCHGNAGTLADGGFVASYLRAP
ncbi:RNA polymerase sigma factor [Catellatospora bangladeshensis]|uniref:Uncharacterized protein n=1 Tax=Catellatospora bangladeshensis TaxID=310355 RepID=A0A8J3NIB1_9ACTN|nr:sigma-70 family RNA polymerase sigma factor [Catellatospora bangladeshensis]GIF81987.1 hypothetical protein Cba03nite_33360 [Catellatospora bangladeshensis]